MMASLSDAAVFLSTPSARRATVAVKNTAQVVDISIHALREEGDVFQRCSLIAGHEFLSTPSARRATPDGGRLPAEKHYFYPRPPRGGRQLNHGKGNKTMEISIHALREEGDIVSNR